MINHARTVLLNQPRPNVIDTDEIFISEDFVPRRYVGWMAALHKAIVPDLSTRAERNNRMSIITRLIHTADLDAYSTRIDRRVTYTVDDSVRLLSRGVTIASIVEGIIAQAGSLQVFHMSPGQSYYTECQELRRLWVNTRNNPALCAGAACMAFVFQSEARYAE